MASAPLEPVGGPTRAGGRSLHLFGPVRADRWVSVVVGVLWLAVSVVVLARPPAGTSAVVWRLVFSLSPLIGLSMIIAAVAASHLQLTALGINRGLPPRQAIPWEAVVKMRIVASRLRFRVVPGLEVGAITVHRLCPAIDTTGGETVPLIEIGSSVSDRGFRVLQRRAATITTYAGLEPLTPSPLEEYRSILTSAPIRWVDR